MPEKFWNTGRGRSYQSWHDMISRCQKPHHRDFKRYGGRGIKVCDRWQAFENFFADMGERPADLQFRRLDNDGDYEPSNCLWSLRLTGIHRERRQTYVTWRDMIRRCNDADGPDYPRYGGRGITVCDHWLLSFDNFLADMGQRPDGLTLDRIENDGNYEPGNCRWATRAVQRANQGPRKNDLGAEHNRAPVAEAA